MKKHILPIATLIATAMLASCGGKEPQNGNDGAGKNTTNQWNAADACALLDKAAVSTALNDNVTETSLGLVNQASGANAATSECTYMLASGGRATLMTRWSPIADNTPDAIFAARKGTEATVAAFGKKVEDVPGLGKAAFFVPGINQMNVFIDDQKFAILTLGSAPADTAKATAIGLVGKIDR